MHVCTEESRLDKIITNNFKVIYKLRKDVLEWLNGCLNNIKCVIWKKGAGGLEWKCQWATQKWFIFI